MGRPWCVLRWPQPDLRDGKGTALTNRPEILMTPGPTPVPPEVLLAQGSPLVYHRGPGYGRLLREVTAGLKAMLKTEGDVLMWEDIGTIHNAVADYGPDEHRLVKRCQVMATMFYGEQ